jgi:predicted nucleotidyltransferase
METHEQVQQRFRAALDGLAAKLEKDYYVLAAIVYGSVARGEAWEKSDIDLTIVLRDGQERALGYRWLDYEGINISADITSRSRLKRQMDGALQGSLFHAIRSHARLLFCKDESIAAWFSESNHVGAHDRAYQLLRVACAAIPILDKAEKWFYVKDDPHYSLVWILDTVNALARVEVVLNGEAPGREVIYQALKHNPRFFNAVYTDLIEGPKNHAAIQSALDQLDGYLVERAETLFGPVLDYLAEAQSMRTASELDAYLHKKAQSCGHFWVYEWLARKGVVQRVSSPVRLTRKSQIELDEPAYFYDGDGSDWE